MYKLVLKSPKIGKFLYICKHTTSDIMMKRYLRIIVTAIIFFMSSVVGFAQNWTVDGVVLDKKLTNR